MGSLSLLQGIFPTQESNWGLLHCRQILCQLIYQGSPHFLTASPKSPHLSSHPRIFLSPSLCDAWGCPSGRVTCLLWSVPDGGGWRHCLCAWERIHTGRSTLKQVGEESWLVLRHPLPGSCMTQEPGQPNDIMKHEDQEPRQREEEGLGRKGWILGDAKTL